jgi:hypothetical protein
MVEIWRTCGKVLGARILQKRLAEDKEWMRMKPWRSTAFSRWSPKAAGNVELDLRRGGDLQ